MEQLILKSVYFNKLKGLNNIEIKFSNTLTAIMGVNGSGKTTVIHALACLYQPDGNGENHKFPEFFVPNTDALWKGRELRVVNEKVFSKGRSEILPSRRYSKDYDRWSPRYENRPKRNVYYIGIDTCLPDIEKRNTSRRIMYKSELLEDKQSKDIIDKSGAILNKDYDFLIDNFYNKIHFTGVKLKSGLKYSSLSMGSGEQRIIKIISVLKNAEAYSLVLIDEIDLLLHVSALHSLIREVDEIARKKHIQVIFTTHSLELTELTKYVLIQYIVNNGESHPSFVFEKITADLIYSMTGKACKTICLYVEDQLAKELVFQLVRKNNMSASVDIIAFGAVENAFTLAASFVINDDNPDNKLIVLDGDRYKSEEDKVDQIKKKLSGTEEDSDEKRKNALEFITEFILPEDNPPEKFLHDTILRCFDESSDIYNAALEVKAVSDPHDWINRICSKLGVNISEIIREVVNYATDDDKFKTYVKPINTWLESHKN